METGKRIEPSPLQFHEWQVSFKIGNLSKFYYVRKLTLQQLLTILEKFMSASDRLPTDLKVIAPLS